MTIAAATPKNTILSTGTAGQSSSTLPLVPPLYALLLADDGSPDKSNTVSIVFAITVIARFHAFSPHIPYPIAFHLIYSVSTCLLLLLMGHDGCYMLSHPCVCMFVAFGWQKHSQIYGKVDARC